MARRTFKIVAWVSTGLFVTMLALAVASIWINPWDHHLSIGEDFHVSTWGRGWDIRVTVFNHADYGPYRGSMIGLVDDQGNTYPPLEDEAYFGDTAGIYYRYFRWTNATLWTLMVSLWYFAALFAVLPTCYWFSRLRSHSSFVGPGRPGRQGR
jgi:hypothetical protein